MEQNRPVYDTIRSKRDLRDYAPRSIPDEVVRRILQAGRMAGSAKHTQPVRFIVVQDAENRRKLAACGDFTSQINAAGLVVALVVLPDAGQWDPERAVQFDAGRSAQNMMLAAWEEGISSCPVTMHRNEDAQALLGLPPGHRVAQVLAFGYPVEGAAPRNQRARLPLEEFVMQERWGGTE